MALAAGALIVVLLISTFVARRVTEPVVTQSSQEQRWCAGMDGASLEQQINACTALLQSGRDTALDLGLLFVNRGIAYAKKDEHARAIQDLDEALRLNPGNALALTTRGYVYGRMGQHQRAIQDYDRAIELQPTYWRPRANRCWERAIVGKLLEGLGDCNEALRLHPDEASIHDSRGLVYLLLRQPDRAIVDYDASLRLDPKKPTSLYGRGLAKRQKGDAAGGNADIAEAKAIKPDIVEELVRLGFQP